MRDQQRDQTRAPIVEAIEGYQKEGRTSFSIPGHKRDAGIDQLMAEKLGNTLYRNDIPAHHGLDDRKESRKTRAKAEELAADAFGAKQSFFSIGGTSLSVHVAMLTVAGSGEKLIVARNTHKSVIAALLLGEVNPIFLQPDINEEWQIENGIDPEALKQTLAMHPDAKGVVVVSPTPYGITSDTKRLADICHSHHIPLIVDEAWGPHFTFHPDLPATAMSCEADLSMGSIHKTMTGLSQASIVNMQGELIRPDRFKLCLKLFESTSPSSLILASADAARRQMVLYGKELLDKTLALAAWAREELATIEGIKVLDTQYLGSPGAKALDPTKLVLDVSGLGVSGYEASDWIEAQYKLNFELMNERHLLALLTIADTRQTVEKLLTAVKAMANWARGRKESTDISLPKLNELYTTCVTSPARAFFGETEDIPFEQAIGRIAAEMVTPYPPGIPRLAPGELIPQTVVDYLQKGMRLGMFEESFDPSLATIRVMKI